MQQSEMKQIELLRSVIYQIIGENRLLLDAIEFVTDNSNYYNVQIEIVYYRDFEGSSKDGKIIMGIPDIVDFYSVAKELFPCLLGNSNYVIETKYSDLGNKDKIRNKVCVCIADAEKELVSNELGKSYFFQTEDFSIYDELAIYALAYSLCHELGHVLHDRYILRTEFNTRERAADYFAFEAIKHIASNNNSDSRLKGAIIGIAQMLLHRSPQEEVDDIKHPHSIERLYALLDFWGIEKDSPYWDLAYNIVILWCNRNEKPVTWERTSSISPKDKFIDAYVHFRKNPKQIE